MGILGHGAWKALGKGVGRGGGGGSAPKRTCLSLNPYEMHMGCSWLNGSEDTAIPLTLQKEA